jgi:ubiquinone/menaquinone biosynthesis C-methylase UbiE
VALSGQLGQQRVKLTNEPLHANTTVGNERDCDRRMPMYPHRGSSTAHGTNVNYRLRKLVERSLLRGVWLDCGCADGGYTLAMANGAVRRVVGIDVAKEKIRQAREASNSPKVSYCCAYSEALPFLDATFDGVFMNEVLEHVANELSSLSEIRRVLRPAGNLVLMSPNRWFPFEGHGMRVRGRPIPFPVPLLPWMPSKLAMRFMSARNYWPGELRDLVRKAGFVIDHSSSVMPVFERYPWLPAPIISWYTRAIPFIERAPIVRRFGVSTLVLAHRP